MLMKGRREHLGLMLIKGRKEHDTEARRDCVAQGPSWATAMSYPRGAARLRGASWLPGGLMALWLILMLFVF